MAVEYIVEFDYTPVENDELALNVGDIITNVSKVSDGWCEGNLNGKRGMFPDNFVKEVKKEQPGSPPQPAAVERRQGGPAVTELRNKIRSVVANPAIPAPMVRKPGTTSNNKKAKVMHEYEPQNPDELQLEVGQIIEVLKQEEEGWWEGNLNGKVGVFPSNFVELIDEEEEKPEPIRGKRVQGVGFGNIFSGGQINLRPTGDRTAAERKPPNTDLEKSAPKPLQPKAGKPQAPTAPVTAAQPAAEIKPTVQAIVRYPYTAANDDELTLNEGDTITVLDQNLQDAGWWKGELRGVVGVFPDNFVELVETKPAKPAVPSVPPVGQVQKPAAVPIVKKEPVARLPSMPQQEAPPPPTKKAGNVKPPDTRPAIETDDHKAKNKTDGGTYRSETLDRAVAPQKPLKPLTASRAQPPNRRPPGDREQTEPEPKKKKVPTATLR